MNQSWKALTVLIACVSSTHDVQASNPAVADDRLVIELFAADPDIVTPFGITVDSRGRVLVVESHTHMRPDDYVGPSGDRVRLLVDVNGDGRADRATTFHDGEKWLMNVAAHANGWIYAVSRNELFRLLDRDGDGRADVRESLAKMETTGDYPHNGFLSLAFDFQGRVYFGMGQNYGASYVLTGSDGQSVSSVRGDGGIFRCSAEGKSLIRIAIGFWNPCGLGHDVFGRLFTVDNDPGNRPPCRLIEVVKGGDFGYRRRELEPFISWNGELPGTLPMVTSTAEAPTDIVAYQSDNLPREYRSDLLVSSWSEYRIDRFHLQASGATFRASSTPMVVGDDEFRPAGMAIAPDGTLLVSDWVDRSYPVHGRGRVWRIRAKHDQENQGQHKSQLALNIKSPDRAIREGAVRQLLKRGKPGAEILTSTFVRSGDASIQATALDGLATSQHINPEFADQAVSHSNPHIREQAVRIVPENLIRIADILEREQNRRVRAAALRRITDRRLKHHIIEGLQSNDRFVRQAARVALNNACSREDLHALFRHADARVRQSAFMSIRDRFPNQIQQLLPTALADDDDGVRYFAIEWIARNELAPYRQQLLDDLRLRPASADLFEVTLAAVARIDGVLRQWRPGRNGDWWKERSNANDIAAGLLLERKSSSSLKQHAAWFLPSDHESLSVKRIQRLLVDADDSAGFQLALVRALQNKSGVGHLLTRIASDEQRSVNVRAEATMALDPRNPKQRRLLLSMAIAAPASVRRESLRTLRGAEFTQSELDELRKVAGESDEMHQLVGLLLPRTEPPPRPSPIDTDQWLNHLEGDGDPAAGERVFFHPRGPGCGKCHRVDGRGYRVGPNLVRSRGMPAFTRRKLLESILQPSKEIALGYVPFRILTKDGSVHVGIPKTESDDGYQLFDASGQLVTIRRTQIESISPGEKSLMPDSLVNQMTDRELQDLLAFLLQPRRLE